MIRTRKLWEKFELVLKQKEVLIKTSSTTVLSKSKRKNRFTNLSKLLIFINKKKIKIDIIPTYNYACLILTCKVKGYKGKGSHHLIEGIISEWCLYSLFLYPFDILILKKAQPC